MLKPLSRYGSSNLAVDFRIEEVAGRHAEGTNDRFTEIVESIWP